MVDNQTKGAFSYRNWKAYLAGHPLNSSYEYPLFTDAQIAFEPTMKSLGPYNIFKMNPLAVHAQVDRPVFVLRIHYHADAELPSWKTTDDRDYTGGLVAEDIAALMSLSLGIRLKAGGANRVFFPNSDPEGRPVELGDLRRPILIAQSSTRPILPNALQVHSLHEADVLDSFPQHSEADTIALLRAARMYQEALWIVEGTPEISWVLLASAIEALANRGTEDAPVEKLRASETGRKLEAVLQSVGCQDEHVEKVAGIIAGS